MNEPQPDQILQVGMGFWASKTLLSAVEMELFTELADRSEPLEMLQGRLGLHRRAASHQSSWRVAVTTIGPPSALHVVERPPGRWVRMT